MLIILKLIRICPTENDSHSHLNNAKIFFYEKSRQRGKNVSNNLALFGQSCDTNVNQLVKAKALKLFYNSASAYHR